MLSCPILIGIYLVFPAGKKTRNDCLIPTPEGFPSSEFAFSESCLIVAIAIGMLYNEAQDEKNAGKRKYLERSVTDINSNDKKKQGVPSKCRRKKFFGKVQRSDKGH